MRRQKSDNLKAVNLSVSLPPSLCDYAARYMQPSAEMQRLIARRVTGIPFDEHHQVLRSVPNKREHKPEPTEKSYIRLARWILEGDVRTAWIGTWATPQRPARHGARELFLGVFWRLSGAVTTVRLDLAEGPGFRHICYDEDVTQQWGGPEGHSEIKFLSKSEALALLDETIFGEDVEDHILYKARVAYAWIDRGTIC